MIHSGKTVRLMFQDEARFGRINKPKYCWSEKGIRPGVPCRHIWEYRYAYGAVEPLTGEGCFLILPYCNKVCMNLFLTQLSEQYPDDVILLYCDSAAWHTSGRLNLPDNIVRFYIPPYMPEMNPIEQIWKKFESVDSITKYLLPWKKSSSDCAILFALCLTKSFPVSRAEIG